MKGAVRRERLSRTPGMTALLALVVLLLSGLWNGGLLLGRSPVPPGTEQMLPPSGVWIQHGGERRGNYRWTFLDNGEVSREEILTVEGRAPLTLTGRWAIDGDRLRVIMGSLQFSFVVKDGALVSGEDRLEPEGRAKGPSR